MKQPLTPASLAPPFGQYSHGMKAAAQGVLVTSGQLGVAPDGSIAPDELSGVLQKIGKQAQRAAQIIRRVHAFVRRSEPKFETVDLNGVILLSTILNFDLSPDSPGFNPGVDGAYVTALPTYAASRIVGHFATGAAQGLASALVVLALPL